MPNAYSRQIRAERLVPSIVTTYLLYNSVMHKAVSERVARIRSKAMCEHWTSFELGNANGMG